MTNSLFFTTFFQIIIIIIIINIIMKERKPSSHVRISSLHLVVDLFFSFRLKGALKSKISAEKQKKKANRGRKGMNKSTERVNIEEALTQREHAGMEEYQIPFIQQNLPCFYWKVWSITGANAHWNPIPKKESISSQAPN